MEKNNNGKVGISAVLLVIALIVIAVMGFFMYQFYNEKNIETQKSQNLQVQLNKKIQELDTEKNKTKEEVDNNDKEDVNNKTASENSFEIIPGFYFNDENGKKTEYYDFFRGSDKRVNYLNEEILYYGNYSISNNKVTVNLTSKVTVGGFDYEDINESKVLTFIDNNKLQDEDNTKYINKNTMSDSYVYEDSISAGGSSTDDSWYHFNYNGGVTYTDSEKRMVGVHEIKDNIIYITYYYIEDKEATGLQLYNGTTTLKFNDDKSGFLDQQTNIKYVHYADGW